MIKKDIPGNRRILLLRQTRTVGFAGAVPRDLFLATITAMSTAAIERLSQEHACGGRLRQGVLRSTSSGRQLASLHSTERPIGDTLMATFLAAFDISITGEDQKENHVTPVSVISFLNAMFMTGWLVATAFGIL
jgi:hypothetical protein